MEEGGQDVGEARLIFGLIVLVGVQEVFGVFEVGDLFVSGGPLVLHRCSYFVQCSVVVAH